MMFAYKPFISTILALMVTLPLTAEQVLRKRLPEGKAGDYIVTAQGKTRVLLNINEQTDDALVLEEIVFPITTQHPSYYTSWQKWVEAGAPGHTSWNYYKIDLTEGRMIEAYSFSRGGWLKIKDADQFLSTLLNLDFKLIPLGQRKRIGGRGASHSSEGRALWQPKMVIEGQCVQGALFDAWKARWPKDGTELSSKVIEVYLPQNKQLYPSFFPYWLQISGMIGKARVRIVDSGHGMKSPQPPLENLHHNYRPQS